MNAIEITKRKIRNGLRKQLKREQDAMWKRLSQTGHVMKPGVHIVDYDISSFYPGVIRDVSKGVEPLLNQVYNDRNGV